MWRIITIFAAVMTFLMSDAETFSYRFNSTPLTKAIREIMEDHPELDINFIYNELENYRTSEIVNADNAYNALRQTIGLNPVTVTKARNTYYVEALQHGRYIYTGKIIGSDNEPVVAATIMLLAPKDSTVLTYGISDTEGQFSIPCDRKGVLGKLTCLGYKPKIESFNKFSLGTILMEEQAISLGTVTVEADNAQLYSDKSIYRPSETQKKASMSGSDLLNRMAIPQLGVISGNSIVTNGGKPVAVFIDYLPATEKDLQAMRVSDVKRVEYLEYPSDPRLQGSAYVVNFIMQQYEYGGYAKFYGTGSLLNGHTEQGIANIRMQYKRMTYDLMGSAYDNGINHSGEEMKETFRLPQEDGSLKQFIRKSETTGSHQERGNYYLIFRATYNSDKVQASSLINTNLDRQPTTVQNGFVSYSPEIAPNSEYNSSSSKFSKFISYDGYYFFNLPKSNSFIFNPKYSLSHTEQNSSYLEEGYSSIRNSATDNTNKLSADIKLKHDFGKFGSILAYAKGSYQYNRTLYSGTADALDRTKATRLGTGVNYEFSFNNLRSHIGFGWDWDKLRFGQETDRRNAPSFDVSLHYMPDRKHSVSVIFQMESWLPSPNFKSDQIITASPFLKYTGNPNLTTAKSYDFDFNYTWVPNNNYSLSAYGWGWIINDRYAYDYEPDGQGVIRTIKQPMGAYAQGIYGIKGTARLLDRSVVLTGNLSQLFNHNGRPYNVNHFHLYYTLQMFYYLKNWNFGITYVSPIGTWDGMMNGIWQRDKDNYYLNVGWSDSNWRFSAMIRNIARWNWKSSQRIMNSEFYSTDETLINGSYHATIKFTVTYTFGFGKKVKRDNEPQASGSASSGILK
ncbi:MAG: outer membrane beta-barrel family protein [Duncaniella sp.]|nr:outer membrane beta-barrel family protein [Duncaniella sp.]